MHTFSAAAVRTSIILQKCTVILCSVVICAKFTFTSWLDVAVGGTLHHVMQATVIVLAIVAELATMSYQRIELEKDWFVVITQGDENRLASECS